LLQEDQLLSRLHLLIPRSIGSRASSETEMGREESAQCEDENPWRMYLEDVFGLLIEHNACDAY
ncbi:hypothetical protein PFISCL1PPCAC_4832, partial [Pristionchus fissidentatus]